MGRRPKKSSAPPTSNNGQSNNGKHVEEPIIIIESKTISPPPELIEKVVDTSRKYAVECGMKGEIEVTPPRIYDYGFEVELTDSRGKTAHLRLTPEGEPRMWELTSR